MSFYFDSSLAARATPQSSIEFIRTSCSTTIYPKLCYASLSIHSSTIQTSPKLLANAALNVTLSSAKSTSAKMSTLSQRHGLKPREVSAMEDCVEELSDAVYELKNSIDEMSHAKKSNFRLMINDVQTWVSAALTDESTCSDGFERNAMNGNLKTAVRGRIVHLAQLTSNALALIDNYSLLNLLVSCLKWA
ncbi:PREDICTED: 21 kDa protein-like isoform X2 [Populus euphratica]|uniref:21 kDa protein-like isoform X2 n=1 Tax=Populus euphratica TaxID=75702 RepID=A0AAJ6X9R8_POPEU|nr:PREDICTED: 21 kDa protein-like isoform X2 [Populus euphratica]